MIDRGRCVGDRDDVRGATRATLLLIRRLDSGHSVHRDLIDDFDHTASAAGNVQGEVLVLGRGDLTIHPNRAVLDIHVQLEVAQLTILFGLGKPAKNGLRNFFIV